MNCKFCETKNPDSAVYCKQCGKRIDGNAVCPVCHKLTPDDAVFCTECGARLDGKNVCEECGTLYEGRFCPACGKAKEKTHAPVKTKGEPASMDESAAWQKILWHVGSGLGLLTAVCSLIFVFLIACSVSVDKSVSGILSDFGIRDSMNLYYCFGEMYEDIAADLDSMMSYSAFEEISLYSVAAVQTTIAAGVLIAVPVLSVLTVIRFIFCYTGKKQKPVGTLAFATFLTYLGGAVLFLAANAMRIKLSVSGSYISIKTDVPVSYSGATTAGIALCAVFAALSLACFIARRGKSLLNKNTIINLSFTAVAIAFLSVVIAFCSQPAVSVSETGSGRSSFYLGLLTLASVIPSALKTDAELYFSFAYIAYILLAAIVVLSVLTTIKLCKNTVEEKHSTGLGYTIAAFATCILCMIFAILAINETAEKIVGSSSSAETGYTGMIVLCVFTALTMIVAIAHKVTDYCLNGEKQ